MRASPLRHVLAPLHPRLEVLHGMPVALHLRDEQPGWAGVLGVCDLSFLPRMGLKGPGAAAWLAERDIPVPAVPNRWEPLPGGGLVARLARSEFLVEDGFPGGPVTGLAAQLQVGPGVYPVPRQDCALALTGSALTELLVQTCNVDFVAQDAAARVVTLTSMVGVSVTVLRLPADGRHVVRLWCDGTMGPYLWETHTGIAGELGGGPVGLDSAFPDRSA
ncbi:MAG: hypothetical protein ACK5VP_02795 [Betaproteobacteria bacterium]